jgi:hypothetical protein
MAGIIIVRIQLHRLIVVNIHDPSHPVSEATWKQRYTRLRAQMQKKEQALSQYKRVHIKKGQKHDAKILT